MLILFARASYLFVESETYSVHDLLYGLAINTHSPRDVGTSKVSTTHALSIPKCDP